MLVDNPERKVPYEVIKPGWKDIKMEVKETDPNDVE
jgi:hypothetical protein